MTKGDIEIFSDVNALEYRSTPRSAVEWYPTIKFCFTPRSAGERYPTLRCCFATIPTDHEIRTHTELSLVLYLLVSPNWHFPYLRKGKGQ